MISNVPFRLFLGGRDVFINFKYERVYIKCVDANVCYRGNDESLR
jgi:hypothetical protein